MTHEYSPFTNLATVAAYAENARRNVPGLSDLHHMVTLLLAERAPEEAHILVVGAGGGMEISAMAEARPMWRFTGVDPSAAMLHLAKEVLSPYCDRVDLIKGKAEDLPSRTFDGATCLLTFHNLERHERLRALQEIRSRLNSGAPLVVVEHTAPEPDPERWMTLSSAFRDHETPDWTQARAAGRKMVERLTLLTPDQEEHLLREGGFVDAAMFYAALTFRGWVARAP
ncbi:class I SAM-dependent methyltransferase [Salipiger sp. PrR002]|uniref:class I SAM-dependent methyltransferase n=1 Tax=Salipiger sp. PrR002 TaxID=2706489 RepID=UPI0034CE350C